MDQSHDIPGGAAHSFDIKGYHFDSVPNVVIFRALVSRCASQPLSPACRIYSKSLDQMQGIMAQAPGRIYLVNLQTSMTTLSAHTMS
ncbi:hypothetical protein M758_10G139100 [Ceratodon purpureus]|nr:hypothetical protein M758_10G139100 [Ceratodon purpureus]